MKIIIFLLLVILQFTENSAKRSTTLKIRDRIRLLKTQIRNSLRHPSPPEDPPAYYESEEDSPIKPIFDDDELKKDDKFKMKKLKTGFTPSLVTPKFPLRTKPTFPPPSRVPPKVPRTKPTRKLRSASTTSVPTKDLSMRLQEMFKNKIFSGRTTAVTNVLTHTTSALDVTSPELDYNMFYRRAYDKNLLDTAQEWMHCSEHVTPYLKGVKKELSRPKKVSVNHDIVHRLYVLLSANTTRMTRAEKKTTMYQISKLKIRLYSWGPEALLNLTKTISRLYRRSKKIDFYSIRNGLITLLTAWQADLSNQTILLKYASVFRPPCIPRGEQGSSKLVRGSTVKPASTPKRLIDECLRRDDDDNC